MSCNFSQYNLSFKLDLNISNVLVFLVLLSRLFQRFMTDGMNKDWYINDKQHLWNSLLRQLYYYIISFLLIWTKYFHLAN